MELTATMVAVVLVFKASFTGPRSDVWTTWRVLEDIARSFGQFAPLAVFVAGIRVADLAAARPTRHVVATGLIVATLAYTASAIVVPVTEYAHDLARGVDVSIRYPFGPLHPPGIWTYHAAQATSPPESVSFSIEQPLDQPANWIAYRITLTIAYAGAAMLVAVVGHLIGMLTLGFRPVRRRLMRWILGLGLALGYLFVLAWSNMTVRSSPAANGFLLAAAILIVPLLQLAIAWILLARRSRSGDPSSGPLHDEAVKGV